MCEASACLVLGKFYETMLFTLRVLEYSRYPFSGRNGEDACTEATFLTVDNWLRYSKNEILIIVEKFWWNCKFIKLKISNKLVGWKRVKISNNVYCLYWLHNNNTNIKTRIFCPAPPCDTVLSVKLIKKIFWHVFKNNSNWSFNWTDTAYLIRTCGVPHWNVPITYANAMHLS